MSLSKPPQLPSEDSPITFKVAIAGHHPKSPSPWYRVTAENGSVITPSYIATEVNRQHRESCSCPWHGSRQLIYLYRIDLRDLLVCVQLETMSQSNPPARDALLPSAEDWPVPAQYTAKLSASGPYAQFVICNGPNDALKRKASSSVDDEVNPTRKQTKVANKPPVVVKAFPTGPRIVLVGDESTPPEGCNYAPTDLHEAFKSTRMRTVVVDQTTVIALAFSEARHMVGWGFYASSESTEDLYFFSSSLMAVIDIHPDCVENFLGMFGNFRIWDWLRKNPSFALHSRSFVLHFRFFEVTPLDCTDTTEFKKAIEEAVYAGVLATAKKYGSCPGMESLCDIIQGCEGSEALKRVLEHIHGWRKRSGSDVDIAIMVDGYDNAARLAYSEDIIASTPRTHVHLETVASCFNQCFYSVIARALDVVTTKPVIQRLMLFGISPAFTEALSLSLTVEDLSHLPGVSGLGLPQIQAQVAWIYGTDNVDAPRVKKAMSVLQEICPIYSYSHIHGDSLSGQVPRRYLRAFFSLIARKPDATSQDLRKALGSKASGAFSHMPLSVLNAISTLYRRGVLFWGANEASDFINQKLDVPLDMGVRRLRLSYSSIRMDTVSADASSREVTEITPLHFAQLLFEESLLTWRTVAGGTGCRYVFPTSDVRSTFNRQIIEKSLLKTYKIPMYKEPAVDWIRDVLSAHLVKRPFWSVVYMTENVPQTVVDLIAETALPRSGRLSGRSFMEVETQTHKRIDTAMLILKAEQPRPQLSLWEFKNVPVGDLYVATMCKPLPKKANGKLEYEAVPILADFVKLLDEIPESEWHLTRCPDRKDWPTIPLEREPDFTPKKLEDLFYVGYDEHGNRVRYSIFRTMSSSREQVHGYGEETARDGLPKGKGAYPTVNHRPNVGGLDDPRLQAMPASKKIKDKIMLGTVTVVAGRFVIARHVGSKTTGREFRLRK